MVPRLRITEEEQGDRQASWFELFYDLVFVALITKLNEIFYNDLSPRGFVSFVLLFIPIWWAWVGQTFYLTRFDSNDIIEKIGGFVQMILVGFLILSLDTALTDTGYMFPLVYAAFRIILILQYLWAGYHLPKARKLTHRYVSGFSVAVCMWIASIFVIPPLRYVVWFMALVVDIGTPLTSKTIHSEIPPHFKHLPERFGLFTIIVLGEAILNVISGLESIRPDALSIMQSLLAFTLLFLIWFFYFEIVKAPREIEVHSILHIKGYQTWLYSHLPLFIAVTAVASALKGIISENQETNYETYMLLLCFTVITLAFNILSLSLKMREGESKIVVYEWIVPLIGICLCYTPIVDHSTTILIVLNIMLMSQILLITARGEGKSRERF